MFKINRDVLATELALLVSIAGQKNVIPALSTIRFSVQDGKAFMLASNSDVALFTEVDAEGDDWHGCIPAKPLYDLIRLASKVEEVAFTEQGGLMQITWGRSRHRLPITDFNKFPEVEGPSNEGECLMVKGEDFNAALERVLPCAARDNTNVWMVQGVKLEAKEHLKVVGTNTHRLGVMAVPSEGELDVFVPLFAASLLPKFKAEKVIIRHDGKQVSFTYDGRVLVSRLMAGKFPNWQAFMPSYLPLTVTVPTEELTGALKRADVTRDETFKTGLGRILMGVVLIFGKEELVIDTKHHAVYGRSEESVAVQSNLNGDLVYMGINPDYVMDFLRFAGETTTCELKDGNSVLKLTDGSAFEYVVVPQSLRASDH